MAACKSLPLFTGDGCAHSEVIVESCILEQNAVFLVFLMTPHSF